MTNEILVELIQAGENTADNMQKLWEQNRGMIWKLAQQYRNKAEIEDLMQEGFIGLCNAVDAWQPDAGASFLHYAVFWIKQGMRRYIDDCGYTVRIPVGQRERIGKYNRICQQYRAKLGRDPQDWEAARLLGVSMAVLEQTKADQHRTQVVSLDKTVGDEEGTTIAELVPAPENGFSEVLDKIQGEQLKAVIWPIVDALPGKQARACYPDEIRKRLYTAADRGDVGNHAGICAPDREQSAAGASATQPTALPAPILR